MSDLTNCSPATITRCAVVHCGEDTVSWKSLLDKWGTGAKHKYIINSTRYLPLPHSLSLSVSSFHYCLSVSAYKWSKPWCPVLFLQCWLSSRRKPPQLCCITSEVVRQALRGLHLEWRRCLLSWGCSQLSSMYISWGKTMRKHWMTLMPGPIHVTTQVCLFAHAHLKLQEGLKEPDFQFTVCTFLDTSSVRSSATLNRLEEFIPNYMGRLRHLFAFAFVWSIGGDLHERQVLSVQYSTPFPSFCTLMQVPPVSLITLGLQLLGEIWWIHQRDSEKSSASHWVP